MSRELFAKQNATSGTVLLRELTAIIDAHVVSDPTVAGDGDEEVDENWSGSESSGGRDRQRHAAAFTARMLESSKKYGGKSMLYHGRL